MRGFFFIVDIAAISAMSILANHWSQWGYAPGLFVMALIIYVNAKLELAKDN